MKRRSFFGAMAAGVSSLIFWRWTWPAKPAIVFEGKNKSLERLAEGVLRLIRKEVRIPSSCHWDFKNEAAMVGDTVPVAGRCVVLADKYVGGIESTFLGICVSPLIELIKKEVRSSSVVACRKLPCPPLSLGWHGIVASDENFSIRLIRDYDPESWSVVVTMEMLYGTMPA